MIRDESGGAIEGARLVETGPKMGAERMVGVGQAENVGQMMSAGQAENIGQTMGVGQVENVEQAAGADEEIQKANGFYPEMNPARTEAKIVRKVVEDVQKMEEADRGNLGKLYDEVTEFKRNYQRGMRASTQGGEV